MRGLIGDMNKMMKDEADNAVKQLDFVLDDTAADGPMNENALFSHVASYLGSEFWQTKMEVNNDED